MPRTIAALALIIMPALVSFLALLWIIEPLQNNANQALWGYRLTAVGFILTFAGFAVTIVQTTRAASAAEAAQSSVRKLKDNLGSFDIVGIVGSARATIQEGMSHVGSSRWEALLGSFNRLNTCLSELIAAPNYLDTAGCETAKDLKGKTLDACRALRKALPDNSDTLDVDIIDQNLRDLEDFLIGLSANLKERIDV